MKATWQITTRRLEEEAILIAREVNEMHAPEIYGKMTIADTTPTQALISACTNRPLKEAEERELRILLMRRYKSMSDPHDEIDDGEFLLAMVQLMECELCLK